MLKNCLPGCGPYPIYSYCTS